jgi:hypothetical protein
MQTIRKYGAETFFLQNLVVIGAAVIVVIVICLFVCLFDTDPA